MSDRCTSVSSPGGHGLMDNGRRTREEMIALYRDHYERQREEADAALAFPDAELRVETFLGPYAQRKREEVR